MKNHPSRLSVNAVMALLLTVFTFSSGLRAQDGAKLFKQNCAVCHSSHTDQKLTGPGLAGVFDRAPKGDWLKKWIINNQKVIKSGDAYANKIYNQYGKATMNVFEGQLSEKDIEAVLGYLKKGPPAAGPDEKVTPGGVVEQEETSSIEPLYLVLGV